MTSSPSDGITIETLDDPGWCFTVELTDTYFYDTAL